MHTADAVVACYSHFVFIHHLGDQTKYILCISHHQLVEYPVFSTDPASNPPGLRAAGPREGTSPGSPGRRLHHADGAKGSSVPAGEIPPACLREARRRPYHILCNEVGVGEIIVYLFI